MTNTKKLFTYSTLSLGLLGLAGLGAACSSKTPAPEATQAPAVAKATPREVAGDKTIDQMIANFKRVHFEYDSAAITDETKNALTENADILRKYPTLKVEVQGHADDRGTSEYNLALGERRASSVKEFLTRSGVDNAQLQTISYGEEKPIAEGEGESVWAENRRAEFLIISKQN